MNTNAADIIEDAYRNPRHRGRLPERTHYHQAENPMCGDVVIIDLVVEDGRVTDAKFDGRGCVISQAAAELMTERVQGMATSDARILGKEDVLEELGLAEIAPARLKCALLPVEALKTALRFGD